MNANERNRLARAYLLTARTPGDPEVAELVAMHGPAVAADLLIGSTWSTDPAAATGTRDLRLVAPGDPEWPAAELDSVGLWVSGRGRLAELAGRAVGMAGTPSATPYGARTAARIGGDLARAGWTVVTVGRFGIDGAATRGALQRTGLPDPGARQTGAALPEAEPPGERAAPPLVLPLGRLVEPRPVAHEGLYRWVRWDGLLVSEHGTRVPDRYTAADYVRQGLLMAALVRALVIVEPGWGSRWLVEAAEAAGVPVLAVPGPVESQQSHGAHELIRAGPARLLTSSADVLAELTGGRR